MAKKITDYRDTPALKKNVFKKIAAACGADLLASELNGEMVSGYSVHRLIESLVLSWAWRVVGDDCWRYCLCFFRQHVKSLAFSLDLPS